MSEKKTSCTDVAAGPISSTPTEAAESAVKNEKEKKMVARVGHPAPDFEAMAFYKGNFEKIKLSDYAGKWVTLCFYPGDFTFV